MRINWLSSLLIVFTLFSQQVLATAAQTVNLYLKDTEAKQAFNLLSRVSGQNVVVNDTLTGKLNMNLTNLSFEDALAAICSALGVTYEKLGSVYVITQPNDSRPLPFLTNTGNLGFGINTGRQPVSLNVRNADLSSVLQQLANQAGVEMVVFGRINRQLTLRLKQIPFDDALNVVLAGSKLSFVKLGNRYIVGDPADTGGLVQTTTQSLVLPFNNIQAKVILDLLPADLDASRIKLLESKNAIVVNGTQQFIDRVKAFAKTVDVPNPQVALEINIVELSKNAHDQLNLIAPDFSLNFVHRIDTIQFKIINNKISSLVNEGKANIKARPTLATRSGKKAKIDISEDVNFALTSAVGTGAGTTITSNLQTINSGTILEVTPTVGKDGLINTQLHIEVSGISSYTTSPQGALIPNVRRRKTDTDVSVLDGETILIAGLIESQDQYSYTKVPLIAKIPILGELLASHDNTKNKSELVIFVTPRLMEEKTVSAKALASPPSP